jgi:hypothetical protein
MFITYWNDKLDLGSTISVFSKLSIISLHESIKRSEVALILFPTACSLTIGEFNMRFVLALGFKNKL